MVAKAGTRYAVTTQDIIDIQAEVTRRLTQEAIAQGIVKSENELVIRDILPNTDLGLTNEVWKCNTSAYMYNTMISIVLPENKTIAFFGISNKNVNPLTSAVKFKLAQAQVKDIIHLEHAFVKDDPTVYFNSVILYKKKETVIIEVYGNAAGEDQVILLGKVAEPKGQNIMGGG